MSDNYILYKIGYKKIREFIVDTLGIILEGPPLRSKQLGVKKDCFTDTY